LEEDRDTVAETFEAMSDPDPDLDSELDSELLSLNYQPMSSTERLVDIKATIHPTVNIMNCELMQYWCSAHERI